MGAKGYGNRDIVRISLKGDGAENTISINPVKRGHIAIKYPEEYN